jgi:hypothetical protein
MADAVDSFIEFATFAWAPYGCFVVGFLYLAASPRSATCLTRLLPAAYAPVAAIMHISVVFDLSTARDVVVSTTSYLLLHVIPAALMVASFRYFQGPRRIHLILVPIALICMAWQFVWCYFLVYGK